MADSLEVMVARIDERTERMEKTLDDHGTRLHDVEKGQWRRNGWAAGIAFVVGTLSSHIPWPK